MNKRDWRIAYASVCDAILLGGTFSVAAMGPFYLGSSAPSNAQNAQNSGADPHANVTVRWHGTPQAVISSHERHLHGMFHLVGPFADLRNKSSPGLPVWTGAFTSDGVAHSFTMIGSDPSRGPGNTVIPTVVIPLRLVYSDGTVIDASRDLIDGQTPVDGILNSPIFRPYPFSARGVFVGPTQ
jgi:hypothetical protein